MLDVKEEIIKWITAASAAQTASQSCMIADTLKLCNGLKNKILGIQDHVLGSKQQDPPTATFINATLKRALYLRRSINGSGF